MSEIGKSLSKKNPIRIEFIESVILDLDFFNLKNYKANENNLEKWLEKHPISLFPVEHAKGIVFKVKLNYFGNSVTAELYDELES